MRRPRASIAEIMAAVAVIALDCGAIHQILVMEDASRNQAASRWQLFAIIDLIGGLPMANLLGIVAWRARRTSGPASRAFLVVGGTLTLAFVVLSAVSPFLVAYPAEILISWLDNAIYPGRPMPLFVVFPAFSAVMTLPMLLPALAAAWFQGRYRLTIERRRPAPVGLSPQLA